MKKLIGAGFAIAALAGPAMAQSMNEGTGTTVTQSDVVATVAPACVIDATTSPITVIVGLNGGAVTGATADEGGFATITCNTPSGRIAVGSNDMKNTAGQPILPSEANTFTDTIKFVGGVKPVTSSTTSGWRLASRIGNSWGAWQEAFISQNTANLRSLRVGINAFDFETLTKTPTAGNYVGKVCIIVNPSGAPLNAEGNGTCP
jgi:hypothetical protein